MIHPYFERNAAPDELDAITRVFEFYNKRRPITDGFNAPARWLMARRAAPHSQTWGECFPTHHLIAIGPSVTALDILRYPNYWEGTGQDDLHRRFCEAMTRMTLIRYGPVIEWYSL